MSHPDLLRHRRALLARLREPRSYPGREDDLTQFLRMDADMYRDRLGQLTDDEVAGSTSRWATGSSTVGSTTSPPATWRSASPLWPH